MVDGVITLLGTVSKDHGASDSSLLEEKGSYLPSSMRSNEAS